MSIKINPVFIFFFPAHEMTEDNLVARASLVAQW